MPKQVKRPTKGLRISNRDLPASASRFPPNGDRNGGRGDRAQPFRRKLTKKRKDSEGS